MKIVGRVAHNCLRLAIVGFQEGSFSRGSRWGRILAPTFPNRWEMWATRRVWCNQAP